MCEIPEAKTSTLWFGNYTLGPFILELSFVKVIISPATMILQVQVIWKAVKFSCVRQLSVDKLPVSRATTAQTVTFGKYSSG